MASTHCCFQYLAPTSANELNIGSKVRKAILYEISNGLMSTKCVLASSLHFFPLTLLRTFDDAQREIYKLISLDVYPKYVSECFQTTKDAM